MGERGVGEVERPPGLPSRRPASAASPAWSVHSEVQRGEVGAPRTHTKGCPRKWDLAGGRCPVPAKSEVPSRGARDGKKPKTRNRAPTSAQPARGRVSTDEPLESASGTKYPTLARVNR